MKFSSINCDTTSLSWNTSTPGLCYFRDNMNNEFASSYTDGNIGVVVCSDVTGKIYYDNILATELANVKVFLNGNDEVVDSTTTNSSGNFVFTQIHNDTYIISASRDGVWKGVNSSDALIIMKHFVCLDTLVGLKLLAADTDASGFVNSSDALGVQQRFVGMITSFAEGDMVFEQDTVILNDATTVNVDLRGLFRGDANASYYP